MLKTTKDQEIRFADIDSMGHVNNAVYLNYFEQSRIHFFQTHFAGVWDWKRNGVIVVKNTIEYKRPLTIDDRIQIDTECTHVGNKSLALTYTIYKHGQPDAVFSQGTSVLVCYNYLENTSIKIPDSWRQRFEQTL